MPRLNPRRPDAIGALIAAENATEKAATYDDSDAPHVDLPVASAATPAPTARPDAGGALDLAGLRLALKLLANGDPAAAIIAAYALPNRIDIKIVDWLVATSGDKQVSSARIAEVTKRLSAWPGQALLRLRYEQALVNEKPSTAEVIRALGGSKPASDGATLMLARAYVAAGGEDDARRLISGFWRDSDFSASTEKAVIDEFSGLLSRADHKARMDRLLYDERSAEALRTAKQLDKKQQALAKAVVAVIKRQSSALKKLDGLPSSLKDDPLVVYSRVQALRRAGKTRPAAELLVAAPSDPKVIVDPDAWWIERRLISRSLIADGDAKLAYRIAAGHSARSSAMRAEAEFHAGWYALEYLGDPATARKHFAVIAAISSRPLSMSRAEYWLGRAAAVTDDSDEANRHFERAAAYPTAFYGQLAMARLGRTRLGLSRPPQADNGVRQRFASRELVQVIQHLGAVGEDDRLGLFYRHLANTLTDPAEIALLAAMAEEDGQHQIALQIGVFAAAGGLPVDTLAFPTAAIPASSKTSGVERPLVYAIARQESAFNPLAVSRAGARGLLQLMPATAKETAKAIGVSYSKDRLTSDPGYNATLGAAHLRGLVDDFGGSYVMTFAAYNAGASRVANWVKRHGDPRDPKVDVVNWIELIPFTETRNYVQRIMENLQVYRARLESPALVIEADLKRGARR